MSARRLFWLDPADPASPFPDPSLALDEPNGLLAMGGDLSLARLRNAYDLGIFPWYNPDESILWWAPDPRAVFATDQVHISRRLARTIRQADFAVTLDTAFDAVMQGCAASRAQDHGTWLGSSMRSAYQRLHEHGDAHSIEVWHDGQLAGGLYGVARGRMFFGESMFSARRNASKLALIFLARQLNAWGFPLIDAQVPSAHLYQMGAISMPRSQFLRVLDGVRHDSVYVGSWTFDIDVPCATLHLPGKAKH